jgi:Protein of unknown function (DUF1559)
MHHRRGITVLEVIVVIIVCVAAIGLAVMLLARHRENAQREQCKLNLKRIGEAFRHYHDNSAVAERARFLPPSRLADGYATWAVFLAPELLPESPLSKWDLQKSYFAQHDEVRRFASTLFFCPARSRTDAVSNAGDVDKTDVLFPGGLGDYASVAGDGSPEHDWTGSNANGPLLIADVLERKDDRIVRWQSRTSLALLGQNESYKFVVGEKHVPADHHGDAAFGDGSLYNGAHSASFSRVAGPGFPLAASIDAPLNNNFGSYHKGVCFFLFADMSARPFTTDTSATVLGRMARRTD